MANPGKAQFKKQASFIPTEQTTASLDFLGASVPSEIPKMVLLLSKLQQNHFRSILQFTINYLKGVPPVDGSSSSASSSSSSAASHSYSSSSTPEAAERLADAESDGFRALYLSLSKDGAQLSGTSLTTLFGGLFLLLRAAYRQRVELAVFQAALNELQLPLNFAQDLVHSYKITLEPITAALTPKRIMFAQLERFRWRVDVTLSTSAVERMAEPSILMQVELSDGTLRQFQVSVAKFHELRYNVARVLKDMGDLERAPILKLK